MTFAAPNSQTGTGVPACAPPYAQSAYQFDEKGSCTFSMTAKSEDPCSTGSGTPCADVTIAATCSGILDSDGLSLTNDPGFSLALVLRHTLDDRDNGDMTVVDSPMRIPFPAAKNGSLKVKTHYNDLTPLLLDLDPIPGCTTFEVVAASLQDPDEAPFAKLGAGVRPNGS